MTHSNQKSPVIQKLSFDDKLNFYLLDHNKSQNYFSILCRNGPLPQKYHKRNDLICTALYLVFAIVMIILVCINGLSQQAFTSDMYQDLNQDIFYGSRIFLWQILFSSCGLLAISFFFSLLALNLPKIMSILSILVLILVCAFFTLIEIKRFFKQDKQTFLNLFKGIASFLMTILLTVIMLSIKQKIIHLGLFLKISYQVIKSHMCKIFTQVIILSLLQIFIWYGFVNLYYGVATVTEIKYLNLHILTKLIVALIWLWTNGALIALSDYMTISYTVHWFYNLSRNEEIQNIEKQNFSSSKIDKQRVQVSIADQNKYRADPFKDLYKKFILQIGTIIFGSLLTFLPLCLMSRIQKIVLKLFHKQLKIGILSKYGYLDTIMQWQNFYTANYRVNCLKQRIKSEIPQIYLLGEIYGDFLKIAFLFIGLVLFHELVQIKSEFKNTDDNFFGYAFTLLLFCLGIAFQIITNFINLLCKTGDTAFFLYCIDLQIQRTHFSRITNYSTPVALWNILRQLTIKRVWKS